VWGSNNPDIEAVIDTDEYDQGNSILNDEISPQVGDIREKVNKQAIDEVFEDVNLVDQLIADKIKLMGKTVQSMKDQYRNLFLKKP
jgi:hypothetical protein